MAGRGKNRDILASCGAVILGALFLPASGFAQSGITQHGPHPPVEPEASDEQPSANRIDVGRVVPIRPGTNFRVHHVADAAAVTVGGPCSTCGDGCCGPDETCLSCESDCICSVVYSNLLGTSLFVPGGVAGALVADDIATTASAGCVLGSMRFRVCGDPLGDGSGDGRFSVTFALYDVCPGAGGEPIFPAQTVDFADNGDYEVVFEPDAGTIIEIPVNAYFGVRFSRSSAGIVVGAPATVGFSADRFSFPGWRCRSYFGGFPGFDHASFDLEITARNDCPDGVCSSTCSGGENDGDFCFRDDCPGGTCTPDIACLGGLNAGGSCITDDDCPSICAGGSNPGDPCSSDADCVNACQSGTSQGDSCVNDDQCPGSVCLIGQCPVATCTRDQCVGGGNPGDFCSVDDCPSGSCDGAKVCEGGTNADQACVYGCVPSFPAYKNSGQAGWLFTSQPVNEFFADDITLAIPVGDCALVSWEVGFKGGFSRNGAVQAELHTFLDDDDPRDGGRIPGTRVTDTISGTKPTILKKTFDPPLVLGNVPELFVVFKTANGFVGAIQTCNDAEPGSTDDAFFVHSNGSWSESSFGSGCPAGFEVALNCAGSPPTGACCDMILTENRTCMGGTRDGLPCARDSQCRVCVGGSDDGIRCDQDVDCQGGICPPGTGVQCVGNAVCRELPEMNCAHPTLWQEGAVCESVCVGGQNDSQACTRQVDCPGGACPGPFAHSCGVATCCTPDDTCEDLTERDCVALVPPGDVIRWRPWGFCDAPHFCPIYACLQQRGDCSVARDEAGCESFLCCDPVCRLDPWCCTVAWDEICVREAQELCERGPGNALCETALAMVINSQAVVGNTFSLSSAGDPTFPCNVTVPGCSGYASTWYTFEATHDSARIHTCSTLPPADDTLVQVFRAGDPTTPDSACQTLDMIACGDNATGCGRGIGSDVCTSGLIPGDTYYVMLSGKAPDTLGVVKLDIESPCPSPPPNCPAGTVEWLTPPPGVIDARQPFLFDNSAELLGIDTITLSAPSGADAACFLLSETNANPSLHPTFPATLTTNRIDTVTPIKGNVYVVKLARPITPGEVTTVTYTDELYRAHMAHFVSLPGDVGASGTAIAFDIDFLVAILDGVVLPRWPGLSDDIDHSGSTGPRDLLRLIDLLSRGWLNTSVPASGVCP